MKHFVFTLKLPVIIYADMFQQTVCSIHTFSILLSLITIYYAAPAVGLLTTWCNQDD